MVQIMANYQDARLYVPLYHDLIPNIFPDGQKHEEDTYGVHFNRKVLLLTSRESFGFEVVHIRSKPSDMNKQAFDDISPILDGARSINTSWFNSFGKEFSNADRFRRQCPQAVYRFLPNLFQQHFIPRIRKVNLVFSYHKPLFVL